MSNCANLLTPLERAPLGCQNQASIHMLNGVRKRVRPPVAAGHVVGRSRSIPQGFPVRLYPKAMKPFTRLAHGAIQLMFTLKQCRYSVNVCGYWFIVHICSKLL
ncbi:unnamed protein product [Colias eurytheme]|nr:unnamed protein product [Colias eurytheme]